jgi:hypothetical protein
VRARERLFFSCIREERPIGENGFCVFNIERRSLRARNAFFKNLKIAATLRREDKERETHTQLRRTKKENVSLSISLSLRVLFFSPDRGARAKRTLSLVEKNALPFFNRRALLLLLLLLLLK